MDITALVSSPVSEDSPAGFDAKYEPEYEALNAEIAKLSSVSQSTPISWQAVADNGEAILARKSKDITVATYVAVALMHNEGAQGFIDGANLLCGLCENFWEEAFPPKTKLRRRLNAYEWWHDRALNQLKKEGQTPITAQLAAEMTDAANRLDSTVAALMEDAQPLRDITEAIRAIPLLPEEPPKDPESQVPVQKQTEQTPSAPEKPAKQTADQPAQESAPIKASEVNDVAASLAAFVDSACAYAFILRSEDPANALAWQLPRIALWCKIVALPPDDGTGQTMVPSPDAQRIEAAERLLTGKNWLKAALAADDLFLSYPLCIDLQRIADEALANLGSAFAVARKKLRSETAAFIERLPGLSALSYDDGRPFVSPATRAWLNDIANEGASGNAAQNGAGGMPEAVIAEAREILANGDTAAALKKLEESHGLSATTNILLRTEELRMLCAQREIKTAAALARALTNDVERDAIAKLEPDVAIEAFLAAAMALDIAGDVEASDAIRGKIATLKPSAVLGWN